jgi:hypothetical protein
MRGDDLNGLEMGSAEEGLATTTAGGHEVQGRELAGDRHVDISVHQRAGAAGWTAQAVGRRLMLDSACWRRMSVFP